MGFSSLLFSSLLFSSLLFSSLFSLPASLFSPLSSLLSSLFPPTIGDLKMPQFPSDSLPLLAAARSSSSPQTPSHYCYWRPQDAPVPLRLPPTIAGSKILQFPSDSLPPSLPP